MTTPAPTTDLEPRKRGNPRMVRGAPSVNPSGRTRGFAGVAKMIAQATGDGADLVAWYLNVWRDENRAHAERERAAEWLTNRMIGRPLSPTETVQLARIEHVHTLPPNWSAFTLEQRRAYGAELEARARAGRRAAAPLVLDVGSSE